MYRIGLLFTLGMLLSKQFLLRNSAAPLSCWKWNVPYRISFWNGPNQVGTLLSEQKLLWNLILVNDFFKSKGSVVNCMTNRVSVHTGTISAPQQNINSCSHCTGATFEMEQKPIRYSVNIALVLAKNFLINCQLFVTFWQRVLISRNTEFDCHTHLCVNCLFSVW